MKYKEAAAFKMPFGKHVGRTLDAIATEDTGLKYLDWLRGERAQQDKDYDVDKSLQAYLNDPSIKKELAALR